MAEIPRRKKVEEITNASKNNRKKKIIKATAEINNIETKKAI